MASRTTLSLISRGSVRPSLRSSPSLHLAGPLRRTLFTRKTPAQKAKSRAWTAAGLLAGGLFAVYAYDSSAGVHRWVTIPALHAIYKDDAEGSHKLAIKVLSSGLSPVDVKADQEDILGFDLWGRHFSNPVGLAGGFDKNAEAIDGLFKIGFGYVEVGTVTPEAQPGNPKPRLFRLPSTQAVINRYGFNSEGHLAMLARLQERIHAYITNNALLLPSTTFPEQPISAEPEPDAIEAVLKNRSDAQVVDSLNIPKSLIPGKVLAINLGKNKVSAPESITDFVAGVETLGPYADVLVVNVSSPNTPGLRSLQRRGMIQELLQEVVKARDALKLETKPRVVLKIAPDLSAQEISDIGVAAEASRVDGIIVSNTTISRPASAGNDPALNEAGGLSGPPLKPLSLRTLQTLYALTSGKIPLIGCGGISTGADAIEYAKAGATFVQLYTALGYQGVGLPRFIKDEIVDQLQKEGKTWKEIVGSGVDLASIKALGRSSNPAALLSGEEQGEGSIDTLKQEIEDVLAGKAFDTPRTIPPWNEAAQSPDVQARATTPNASQAATSAATESGITDDGTPQIIIIDRPPAYAPAPAMTLESSGLADAIDVVKDAAHQTKEKTEQVLRSIRDEGHFGDAVKEAQRVLENAAHHTKEETEEALRVLREKTRYGEEILKDTAHLSKEKTEQVLRSIRDEGDFSGAAKALGEQISHDVRERAHILKKAMQEGDFSGAVSRLAKEVEHETASRLHVIRQQLAQEGKDWRLATEELAKQTEHDLRTRTAELTRDIKDQGDFTAAMHAAAIEAQARLKALGRSIKDDGEFGKTMKDFGSTVKDDLKAKTVGVEEAIRNQGDATGAAREVGQEAKGLGQQVVDDLKKKTAGLVNAIRYQGDAPGAAKEAGREVKQETEHLTDQAKGFGEQVAADFKGKTEEVAYAIKHQGDASRAAGEIGQDVKERTEKLSEDVTKEGKGFGEQVAADLKRKTAGLVDAIRHQGDAEGVAKQIGEDVKDRTARVGKAIEDEGDFTDAVKEFGQQVYADLRQKTSALALAIKNQGDAPSAARALGDQIAYDLKDRTSRLVDALKNQGHTPEAAQELSERFISDLKTRTSELGSKIHNQGDATEYISSIIDQTSRELKDRTSTLEHKIKKDGGSLTSTISEIADEVAAETKRRLNLVAHELRTHAREGARDAKGEVQKVADGVARTPANGTGGREGLTGLFSTFGMRGQVGKDDKKLV